MNSVLNPRRKIPVSSPLWPVVLLGLLFVGTTIVNNLSSADWDPTLYLAIGEESGDIREFAESRLGKIFLRPDVGHDGRFFLVQSHDPLLIDPEEHAEILDRPRYRSQRMLFPLIVGGGGLVPSQGIVYTMLGVNLLAMAWGAFSTARLAVAMGMSRWWGLAFPLNIGFLAEMNIGGAGVVAGAAMFAALVAVLSQRFSTAVCLLALAALAREAMLVAAAGVAFWLWRFGSRRSEALRVCIAPAAAVAAWYVYAGLRLGWESTLSEVQEIGLPFLGIVQAFQAWVAEDPLSLAAGVVLVAVMAAFSFRTFRSNALVGWAVIGFVALGLVMTRQVWLQYFDMSRAIAPVLTAYVLLLFAPNRDHLKARQFGANDLAR